MSIVKPFRAVRPADNEKAMKIAALPYDVYSREEAAKAVVGKPLSFLNIDRPETFFDPKQDMYADCVYARAKEEYELRKAEGSYIREETFCYYVYELTMDGRSQTGIVGVTAVSDYENGICKKHENTVAEKEKDRICHVDAMSAQTGPIFLAYHSNDRLKGLVTAAKAAAPLFDFLTEEGIGQRVWKIDEPKAVAFIEACFSEVPATYIADGHHRAASAVRVSRKRRSLENANAQAGEERLEESEYFLSVLFPEEELKIFDYNRTVKDLNGLAEAEFLKAVEEKSAFTVKKSGEKKDLTPGDACEIMRPREKGTVGMYLNGSFYELRIRDDVRKAVAGDPVRCLDVSVLQESLLAPILGIGDPRTDKRIKFTGGIRGLKSIVDMADSFTKDGSIGVSFAMYPTSMQELFAVADAGLLMPPKSTWFEPKLRSGLFIHEI